MYGGDVSPTRASANAKVPCMKRVCMSRMPRMSRCLCLVKDQWQKWPKEIDMHHARFHVTGTCIEIWS